MIFSFFDCIFLYVIIHYIYIIHHKHTITTLLSTVTTLYHTFTFILFFIFTSKLLILSLYLTKSRTLWDNYSHLPHIRHHIYDILYILYMFISLLLMFLIIFSFYFYFYPTLLSVHIFLVVFVSLCHISSAMT